MNFRCIAKYLKFVIKIVGDGGKLRCLYGKVRHHYTSCVCIYIHVRVLAKAGKQGEVTLLFLIPPPFFLSPLLSVCSENDMFSQICIAKYFGSKYIRLTPPPPPPPPSFNFSLVKTLHVLVASPSVLGAP